MNKFLEMLRCVVVVLVVLAALTLIVGGGSLASAADVISDADPKLVQYYVGTMEHVKDEIGIDKTVEQVGVTTAWFGICESVASIRVDFVDEKIFRKHMVASYIAMVEVVGMEGTEARTGIAKLLANIAYRQNDFESNYTRGKVTDAKKAEVDTKCASMKTRMKEIERGLK